MSVRVWNDPIEERAGFYCSNSETCFGPLFIGVDADEQAEDFLDWLGCDPRKLSAEKLAERYAVWIRLPENVE